MYNLTHLNLQSTDKKTAYSVLQHTTQVYRPEKKLRLEQKEASKTTTDWKNDDYIHTAKYILNNKTGPVQINLPLKSLKRPFNGNYSRTN